MKIKKLTERITINLEPALKKRMDEESIKLNMSLSDLVRESVVFYLDIRAKGQKKEE